MQVGNLVGFIGAMFANFRPEVRTTDPELSALTNKHEAVFWYNSTEKQYKFYNGSTIETLGSGSAVEGDFLPLGGGTLTGPLILSDDQLDPTADGKMPVPFGQFKTEMDKKMNKLSGLGTAAVVVTDEEGNLTVSAVTATEVAFLTGAKSNIQTQLDNKMNSGDLVLTGDLDAGSNQIINLSPPQGPQYALRKMDLDEAMEAVPVLRSAKTIVRDASVVPVKEDGARYLIADKDQLNPEFGNPESVVNWCVLEYREELAAFNIVWEPTPQASGTMLFIDDKKNYYEFNGSEFTERVKGLAPKSGSGTTVGSDGKVDVKIALPLEIGEDGNISLKVDETSFSLDAVKGLSLAAGGVSLESLNSDMFGTGLEIKENKLVVTLDISEFIKSGSTVESLKVTGEPTEETDVINKKYFDDNKGSEGASSFTYTSTAPALSHVVTHNLGKKYANVTVWVDDAVVQPSSIEATSANAMTITLPEEKDCVVVVI